VLYFLDPHECGVDEPRFLVSNDAQEGGKGRAQRRKNPGGQLFGGLRLPCEMVVLSGQDVPVRLTELPLPDQARKKYG
jgi:hypothetical protein